MRCLTEALEGIILFMIRRIALTLAGRIQRYFARRRFAWSPAVTCQLH